MLISFTCMLCQQPIKGHVVLMQAVVYVDDEHPGRNASLVFVLGGSFEQQCIPLPSKRCVFLDGSFNVSGIARRLNFAVQRITA